jgi:hypothetical protein
LQAIRDRLAMRAGATLAPCLPGRLLGHVERIADGNIEGWALNDADRASPVRLILVTSSGGVSEVIANHYRPDLDRAGLADGACGLRAVLPVGAIFVAMRRAGDGAILPASEFIMTTSAPSPLRARSRSDVT